MLKDIFDMAIILCCLFMSRLNAAILFFLCWELVDFNNKVFSTIHTHKITR